MSESKQTKNVNKNVNKTNVEARTRLEECMNLRKIGNTELAKEIPCSRQYINELKKGKANLNYSFAVKLGEVLHVNSLYLMGESDNIYPTYKNSIYANTLYRASDFALLSYISFKHEIIFCIESSDPGDNSEKKIKVNNIHNIDFSKPTCVYSEDKNGLEDRRTNAIIKAVIVDGKRIKYGEFLFIISHIERDIDFMINSSMDIIDSYKRNIINLEELSMDMQRNKELYNSNPETIIRKKTKVIINPEATI